MLKPDMSLQHVLLTNAVRRRSRPVQYAGRWICRSPKYLSFCSRTCWSICTTASLPTCCSKCCSTRTKSRLCTSPDNRQDLLTTHHSWGASEGRRTRSCWELTLPHTGNRRPTVVRRWSQRALPLTTTVTIVLPAVVGAPWDGSAHPLLGHFPPLGTTYSRGSHLLLPQLAHPAVYSSSRHVPRPVADARNCGGQTI